MTRELPFADRILRGALWASVALNLIGVVIFGSAAIGRPVMPMPLSLAPFYAAQIGLTIAIFAGVYAWLARQATINRPLLFVSAVGKIGFFTVFVAYAAAGHLPWATVPQAAPDLLLGGIYLAWLARNPR